MGQEDEEIISSKKASEILHISQAYFLQMLKNGEIPINVIRVGKYSKFLKKEVEEYWKSRFFKPASKEDKGG